MNPYDFVPVDWQRPPQRRRAPTHERLSGLTGRLLAIITAERPLFIKHGNTDRFFRCKGQPAIPGTTLKGLFRSVIESVAQGCFRLCKEPDHSTLPAAFKACSRFQQLCPACRLFGMIQGETLWRGCVGFEDALCTKSVKRAGVYTAILSSPKSYHAGFYRSGKHIAGRKFYFHHREDNLLTATDWLPHMAPPGRRQNQYLRDPLGPGTGFQFAAHFENVEQDDFAALLYALSLEEGMRHQVGYAKPCGFGTIRVELTRLELHDLGRRYRDGSGQTVLEGTALQTELTRRTVPFATNIPPATRDGLHRIWAWPPPAGVSYRYPTQQEFNDHATDPISTTDTW
jgi:CRISPR/Cas system CSM-associated protein Csm3 (group 7 of RAMP superfamily)